MRGLLEKGIWERERRSAIVAPKERGGKVDKRGEYTGGPWRILSGGEN